MRCMLLSQSGKLITLAALPTHSTTTVANICTHTFKRELVGLLVGDKVFRDLPTYLSNSDTY